MFQSANLAASVKGLWQASTLPGLCPGGILYGLLKVPAAKPYARLGIFLEGEPEIVGTGRKISLVIQPYRIEISVWSNAALGNAETIQQALDGLIGQTTKFGFLTSSAWTLDNMQIEAPLTEEAERSNAGNVFIAGATWLSQIQENRA